MDIRCERCGTEYEIDDSRVTDAGVSVKCSTCELVFLVRPGAAASAPSGFQIRRDGQPLASCPDLATAQRWVSERRLLRSDELDRNGVWTRLGEAPELLPFFALVDAAQRTPPPATAAAPRFTAPLFATNPAIPMLPKEEPVRRNPRSTMQFHAPSNDDFTDTKQHFAADPTPSPAATTQQFLVKRPSEVDATAATELALPALTLGAGSKPPAVTMQFRVPVDEVAPDAAKTETMSLPTGPMQPQGALPEDVDALETLQFKVRAGPVPAETLAGAPLLSAPAGARASLEGASPRHEGHARPKPDTSEIFVAAPPRTPALARPVTEDPAPTSRQPAVAPAWATGSSPVDDDDPEILAFRSRGRGRRVALVLVLVVGVLAALGWFVVKPMLDAPATPPPVEPTAKVPPPPAEEANAHPAVEEPLPAPAPKPAPTAKAAPRKQPEKTTTRKAEPQEALKATTKAAAVPVLAPAPVEAGLFDDLPPPAPVDVDALIAQGNQWLKRGQPAKALDYFNQAVTERPGNAEAVYLRGVARFDLGRTDESIVDLQRALQLSPRFADAMIVLADAWKTKGNVAQARTWYQKYLDLAPQGSDAAAARANLARLQ